MPTTIKARGDYIRSKLVDPKNSSNSNPAESESDKTDVIGWLETAYEGVSQAATMTNGGLNIDIAANGFNDTEGKYADERKATGIIDGVIGATNAIYGLYGTGKNIYGLAQGKKSGNNIESTKQGWGIAASLSNTIAGVGQSASGFLGLKSSSSQQLTGGLAAGAGAFATLGSIFDTIGSGTTARRYGARSSDIQQYMQNNPDGVQDVDSARTAYDAAKARAAAASSSAPAVNPGGGSSSSAANPGSGASSPVSDPNAGSSSSAAVPGSGSSSSAAVPGTGSSSSAAVPGSGSSSSAVSPQADVDTAKKALYDAKAKEYSLKQAKEMYQTKRGSHALGALSSGILGILGNLCSFGAGIASTFWGNTGKGMIASGIFSIAASSINSLKIVADKGIKGAEDKSNAANRKKVVDDYINERLAKTRGKINSVIRSSNKPDIDNTVPSNDNEARMVILARLGAYTGDIDLNSTESLAKCYGRAFNAITMKRAKYIDLSINRDVLLGKLGLETTANRKTIAQALGYDGN